METVSPKRGVEQKADDAAPVVVFEHTLVATDTLLESALLYIKAHPFRFLSILVWLLRGKAHLAERLAHASRPEAATLPYRQVVLDYIRRARAKGLPVFLATAGNDRAARQVAEHLRLFSGIISTAAEKSLPDVRKLETVLGRTADHGFAYVGSASADVPFLKAAKTAVVVDPARKLRRALKGHRRVEVLQSGRRKGGLKTWTRAIRVHQWAKNLLVFLPAIMAHRIFEPALFVPLFFAFFSISFSSSAIYLLNDLLDLEDDRKHVHKKNRPLASGLFSIRQAVFSIPVLLVLSYLTAIWFLPPSFFFPLFIYLVLTSLYSFLLKRKIIIDVITLATLYTFRVIAGAVAVNILVSSWFLVFSMFFFLSLALMKRYSELLMMQKGAQKIPGRGYVRADAETTMTFGIASGQLSLLVFALYMNDEHMRELYGKPKLLWFVVPVLFYWTTRMWMIAHRGELAEDPVVFTIKDPASYVALALVILVMLAASLQIDAHFPVRFLVP